MSIEMSPEIEWARVARDFEWDGSLRDLYVRGATIEDWQAIIDAIRARYAPLVFRAGDTLGKLPERVAEIFPHWATGQTPYLQFAINGVDLGCHFFTPQEVEFSLDPRQIVSSKQLDVVLGFLSDLARITGKEALLTPENSLETPIFRAAPATGVIQYVPSPSRPAV
jgi:hypothetical protein